MMCKHRFVIIPLFKQYDKAKNWLSSVKQDAVTTDCYTYKYSANGQTWEVAVKA